MAELERARLAQARYEEEAERERRAGIGDRANEQVWSRQLSE